MSLGADVERELPEFRAQAESAMPGTCVIRRPGEVSTVWNEALGEYETAGPLVVYSGPCDLKFVSAVVREIDAQGQRGVEQEPVLKVLVDGSEAVRVDDVAELTAHRTDSGLVGVEARIAGRHGGTVSARRFPVEITSWGS